MLKAQQVDEFPAITPADMAAVIAELHNVDTTVMFHAEMEGSDAKSDQDHHTHNAVPADPTAYQTFLDSRPATLETRAINSIIDHAPSTPSPLQLHIVHLAAADAIPALRAARARGIQITAETCFHYLALTAEDVPAGDTRHKCCPPIRSAANADALWKETFDRYAEPDGVIKTVVSDHSPCTPELKRLPSHIPGSVTADSEPNTGSFSHSWGGISSVGLGLSILWSELERRGHIPPLDANNTLSAPGQPRAELASALEAVATLTARNTAAQVRLTGRKGDLVPGCDADVCVFDPDEVWTVENGSFLFKNKCSPYAGKTMRGRVRQTWLRGRKVFDLEKEHGLIGEPAGRLLLN